MTPVEAMARELAQIDQNLTTHSCPVDRYEFYRDQYHADASRLLQALSENISDEMVETGARILSAVYGEKPDSKDCDGIECWKAWISDAKNMVCGALQAAKEE